VLLEIVELTDPADELLLPWLDLCETAFPPAERVLISTHLRILARKARGEATEQHMLAALDAQRALVGMAWYQVEREAGSAFLWYLAVVPPERGRGLGADLYMEILRRVAPEARALFFEVEIPAQIGTDEGRRLAARRIGFYRRLGARRLSGIRYLQYVGPHQPPMPMHVMVHPLRPPNAGSPAADAAALYALAREFWGDWLSQDGDLALD
jgi:GNAT superfamily N-acetyltransferase